MTRSGEANDARFAAYCGARKRGAEAQAVDRSRGGRTTKIHARVDARGRPIVVEVTPRYLGDVRVATAWITRVQAGGRLTADAAYDRDGLCRFLLGRGTVPVIPNNPTRKRHHLLTKQPIATAISSSACFFAPRIGRRIATRFDKLAANFAAAVTLAAVWSQ